MNAAIQEVIEKHVMAYGPINHHGCVAYWTDGVQEVANELDISYKAADELTRSWIRSKSWRTEKKTQPTKPRNFCGI